MVKALNVVLLILNIAVFASIGMLIFYSNTVLSVLGIPHENVEGFTYREVTLARPFAEQRSRIQTLGVF